MNLKVLLSACEWLPSIAIACFVEGLARIATLASLLRSSPNPLSSGLGGLNEVQMPREA